MSTNPSRLGQHEVRALAASAETLRSLARSTGGYVPALAAVAERGEALAALPANDVTQAACLRATTEAWTLAGWSAFDAGKRRTAFGHYDHALTTAEAAGDPIAAAQVLRYAGVLEAEAGRHQQALRLFQLGEIRLQDAPPGPRRDAMLAGLLSNASTSYAEIGRRDLALAALSKTEDSVEMDPFNTADLEWRKSETYAALGDFDTTHDHATTSLSAWPTGSQRDAIKAEITIAGLHRRTGERDAEELLAGCWQRVEGTASVRARQRLMRAEGTLPT